MSEIERNIKPPILTQTHECGKKKNKWKSKTITFQVVFFLLWTPAANHITKSSGWGSLAQGEWREAKAVFIQPKMSNVIVPFLLFFGQLWVVLHLIALLWLATFLERSQEFDVGEDFFPNIEVAVAKNFLQQHNSVWKTIAGLQENDHRTPWASNLPRSFWFLHEHHKKPWICGPDACFYANNMDETWVSVWCFVNWSRKNQATSSRSSFLSLSELSTLLFIMWWGDPAWCKFWP